MIKISKTCIVITKNKDGKLMMAGDRLVSFGEHFSLSMNYPKVNKKRGLLLGASGNGDLCGFLVDNGGFSPPLNPGYNVNAYMFQKFKPALVKAVVKYGFGDYNKLPFFPEGMENELIIGLRGQVWVASFKGPVISVEKMPDYTYAIGCGGLAALAIMKHELYKNRYLTKQQLQDIFKTVGGIIPGCDTNCDIIEED